MGYGEGGYGLGGYGQEPEGEGSTTEYYFEPPTHEEPMRIDVAPLYYYRLTWANTIVNVGGTYTSIRTPSFEFLEDAGEQGVDWFRGGGVYKVTAAIKAALEADGFTVRTVNVPPGGVGYGAGGYGDGGYGE